MARSGEDPGQEYGASGVAGRGRAAGVLVGEQVEADSGFVVLTPGAGGEDDGDV
ncbi:hypothetical protein [Streptomyces halobius]|uniref:Uncharacterized protein n=1 Tax=Streptomyces halobius TaxID=2879846 RepID=A0ABY4MK79_9ACTN|nr:hypothetical protein [Streptomyces halobius]UQA98209.1 hypothetical protein K9S39_40300 [Streptomyces halobius]